MLSRAGPSSPAEQQERQGEINAFVAVASRLQRLKVSGAEQKELRLA